MSEQRRPFLEHLEELRRRLLRCFLWVLLATVVGWNISQRLLSFLLQPAGEVVFLSPVEPFLVRLKVSFLAGVGLSFPLLLLEGWCFLRPALRPAERWTAFSLLPVSLLLFLSGVWFGWRFLLPAGLSILLSFGEDLMTPMLTIGHYVGFAGWILLGCGLIFQIPLAVLLLTRIGFVQPRTLLKHWRLAIVVILVMAALLTPTPDIFTQLLLAGPLGVLYLFSVGLAFVAKT